ncbi:hypothetical protein V1514DRAFT_321209 [Lipomyces japonicus]|uniref:uncharacterized protein n=1 Tax=Lipomyces japonicus TaxID=56871 RepID=UPI0034CFD37C
MSEPLTPDERDRRIREFDSLILRFEHWESTVRVRSNYNPISILRVMKEKLENSDRFLRYFFEYLTSELNGSGVSLDNVLSALHRNSPV